MMIHIIMPQNRFWFVAYEWASLAWGRQRYAVASEAVAASERWILL